MGTKVRRGVCGLGLAGVILGIAFASRAQVAGRQVEGLAQRLVAAAGVKEGDLVQISGSMRDGDLLEELAVQARKAGANPLVTLNSERMFRQMFAQVPEKYDTLPPAFARKVAEAATVVIAVDFLEDPGAFADVPPGRRAAVNKAGESIEQLLHSRNVRQVSLGNGMYPTRKQAALFGMPQPELSKMFWEAVNVPPSRLQATGDAVKAALSAGKELRLTHANGTDLKVRIEGRPVFVSDGVISAEEQKKGGAACSVWLPAGEVFFAPVPGTAEGTVVVDRHLSEGKEVQGLTLTFQGGKLVSMTAKSGLAPLKAFYDAAGPGKELLGAVDFGINPALRVPPGSKLRNWVPAGMVTVMLGGNLWAGGDNATGFGLATFLPGTTVTVDGKPVVEKGALKL